MLNPKNVSHPLFIHDHCRPPSARPGTSRCAPRWRTATTRPGAPGSRWRPRPAPPSPCSRRWSRWRCRTRARCSQTPPAASTGGTSLVYLISTISTISRWEGEGEDMQWVLIQGTCTNTQTTQTTGQAGGQGRILGLGLGLGVNAGLNLGINAGFGINAGLGAGAGAGTGAGAAGQNCNKQWVSRPR